MRIAVGESSDGAGSGATGMRAEALTCTGIDAGAATATIGVCMAPECDAENDWGCAEIGAGAAFIIWGWGAAAGLSGAA